MILVDTNVWSEAFRSQPDNNVRDWAARNASQMWLSTVVIGELLSGAHRLPEGKRKNGFLGAYDNLIRMHANRIALFDLPASLHYGPVLAFQEKAGRDPGTADTQIAATAMSRGMALATRNIKDFEGLGIELINPWAAQPPESPNNRTHTPAR